MYPGIILNHFEHIEVSPPTVNVIKSNAVQVINSMTQSLDALGGGELSKRGHGTYDGGVIYQMADMVKMGETDEDLPVEAEDLDFLISA